MSAAAAPVPEPMAPPPRARRARRLLARVALYSTFLLVGVPLAFSHVMLKPLRQPTTAAPSHYESGTLASEGLSLRFWCRRGSAERASVVIVHGVGDTLESYVDRADGLFRRGHTVMLVDLRGHGGSEGRHMTLGGREREDVRSAMDWLRGQGLARSGLVLMGHSMGAVAVIRAAAGQPDVRAVIAEAPFDTYRETVAHHARLLYGLPRWVPIIPLSIAFAEWRAGFDADDVDAVSAAREIRAPLFAMVDGLDPRMPEPVVRRIVETHPGPHRLWVVPGVDHVGAVLHPEYWTRLLAFLDESGL